MEKIREEVELLKNEGWSQEEMLELAGLICEEYGYQLFAKDDDDDLVCKVSGVLKSIGIAVHVKGYNYIREAIVYCFRNYEEKVCMSTDLYPQIAKKFHSTENRVERSIRHAIEKLWEDNVNPEIIKKIFSYEPGPDRKKPVNTEFIYSIVEYLRFN
ncbi:Stage 0 sporulation protein A [compost metagenome]